MGLLIRKIAMSQIDEHLGNVDITAEDYDALGETIFSLKNPLFSSQQIFNSIRKLYNNLEYMKYPKNSIPMLLRGVESSNRCICGKEMDENMRGNVQRTIDRYSLQDPYLIINDVRNSIGNFKNSPLFNYYLVKSEMEATKREMTSIREKKPTKGKIVEATLFPEITTIAQTIVDLDHQIENIGYDLLCLTDAGYNDDPQSNIPACRRKIRDISLNMENADIAEEFRLKTELFGDMMDEVYRIVSKNIKDKIITSMNSKIHSFIKEGVFIEDIDGYIILNDKKINDQYKVAIEILFMNSVLELMDVDLPIVINSQHLSADLIKKIGLFIPQIIMVSGRRDLLNGGDNVAVQNV